MRRILIAVSVIALPVSFLTLGFAGTAGAAGGKIVCTTITGNAGSDIVVSGCTGGNTGGSSQPLPATALAAGGTVTWVSGSATTIAAPALTSELPKKCPGYVKPPKTGPPPAEPAAEAFTASVTSDTGDGMLLPSTAEGQVCVGTDGTITALKPIEFLWTPSTLTCTSFSGNAASNITIGGCTGGDTGGSSVPMPATSLATGGTVDWVSGSSTTISAPTLTATNNKACPGYVKPPKTGPPPAEPTADNILATVTADSGDGLALPGSAKGAVCIGTDGTITALKPLTAK